MVIPESICHFRHCKMDESQVNCWLKQMVKIRKGKGVGEASEGSDNKEALLEIKSKPGGTGRKSQDGSHVNRSHRSRK